MGCVATTAKTSALTPNAKFPAALKRGGGSEQELLASLKSAGFALTALDPRYDSKGLLIAANLMCQRRNKTTG